MYYFVHVYNIKEKKVVFKRQFRWIHALMHELIEIVH